MSVISRKALVCVLSFAMVFTSMTFSSFAGTGGTANTSAEVSATTVNVGDEFTVAVSLSAANLNTYIGSISFDNEVVEYEGYVGTYATAHNNVYLKVDDSISPNVQIEAKLNEETKSSFGWNSTSSAARSFLTTSPFITITFKAIKAGDANLVLNEKSDSDKGEGYDGKIAMDKVTVVNPLQSIKITTAPTKTTYCADETFDKTGMVVKAVYADKSEKDVTKDCEIDTTTALKTTDTSITVKYSEGTGSEKKTATQEITVNKHDYEVDTTKGDNGWTWTGFTGAKVALKCKNCNHTEEVTADSKDITSAETTAATCENPGKTTYTAKIYYNEQEFTCSKVDSTTPAKLGHKWKVQQWTWNSDNTQATVKLVCENNNEHTKEVTATTGGETNKVTVTRTLEPGCTTKGNDKYAATVTVDGQTFTTEKNVEVAAGHTKTHKAFTQATMSSDGNKEYWYCSACKKYFSDEACTSEYATNAWKINKISSVTLDQTTYNYTEKAITPTATVVDSAGTQLVSGTDYTISYSNNINAGTATATITFKGNYSGSTSKSFNIIQGDLIEYTTHVQNVGWQEYVADGAMAGTSGKSLRLEGIKIRKSEGLSGVSGSIQYQTHIQNIGWQDYVSDDEMSGTSGQSLRLEAIRIKLTGDLAETYDVYYRVHAENVGWMGWAKNGQSAGTAGYSYRLEGIEIQLVEKGGAAPGTTTNHFLDTSNGSGMISYTTHVQNVGWQSYVSDGAMAGTSGMSYRLEGIYIKKGLAAIEAGYTGSIQYRTHIQNIGWESGWKADGELSGTSGRALRLEAIQIQLTGDLAETYDVYYRVHAQNVGWMGWAKNGESAGTAGYGYRLEGIEIQLVEKGGAAPGSTQNHYIESK